MASGNTEVTMYYWDLLDYGYGAYPDSTSFWGVKEAGSGSENGYYISGGKLFDPENNEIAVLSQHGLTGQLYWFYQFDTLVSKNQLQFSIFKDPYTTFVIAGAFSAHRPAYDLVSIDQWKIVFSYGGSTSDTLPKMQPPQWQENYLATWETIEHSVRYQIKLYKKDESGIFQLVDNIETIENQHDYTLKLPDLGAGEYAISAQAIGDGESYLDGEESDLSLTIVVIPLPPFEGPPPQVLEPSVATSANPMIIIQVPIPQLAENQEPWLLHFKLWAYKNQEKTEVISEVNSTTNPDKFHYSIDNGSQWMIFPTEGLGQDLYGALVRVKLNVGPRQQVYVVAAVGTES